MKTIGIIVVTYNRLDCLKKNIDSLTNLMIPSSYKVKIFVVNNASTDGTKQWLSNLNNKNIEIINLNTNTGGAGGFYNGMKYAVEQEVDYIWGMDDDAYPEKEALNEIINIVNIKGENACYWSNCNNDKEFTSLDKKVEKWMFVGFFIPVNIVNAIGYPREDFFIYHDDTEYSRRITKRGYNIFKVKKSIINHKDAVSNVYEKKILNKNLKIPKLSDWKMYYLIRNGILMYSKNESIYWKNVLLTTPKLVLKIILVNPKQKGIAFKGYIHGIIGKTGKIILPS